MHRPSWTERILAILLLGGFYVFLVWTLAVGAEIPSPLAEVRQTVTDLKNIVSNPKLKGAKNNEERRDRLREKILSRMDFDEMAKRSLGRHWLKLSDPERKEYLKVFPEYMQYVYRKTVFESVDFIDSVSIRFLKERIDGEFAEVDLVIDSSPEDIKVTFKLRLVDGHWKAYDIVIANISQVQNNRSQFDRVITAHSFKKLLELLRGKS